MDYIFKIINISKIRRNHDSVTSRRKSDPKISPRYILLMKKGHVILRHPRSIARSQFGDPWPKMSQKWFMALAVRYNERKTGKKSPKKGGKRCRPIERVVHISQDLRINQVRFIHDSELFWILFLMLVKRFCRKKFSWNYIQISNGTLSNTSEATNTTHRSSTRNRSAHP